MQKIKRLFVFALLVTNYSACNNSSTDVNSKELEKGKVIMYKDFDFQKINLIPFAKNDTIAYPYITINERVENVLNLNVHYTKEKAVHIVFEKKEGLWQAEKEKADIGYSPPRIGLNKIILLNDSTLLQMDSYYKGKNFVSINGYAKYTLEKDTINSELYTMISVPVKDAQKLLTWDTASYQKSTSHPWYIEKIRLFPDSAVTKGIERRHNAEYVYEEYQDVNRHKIGNSSFFYYLLRSW